MKKLRFPKMGRPVDDGYTGRRRGTGRKLRSAKGRHRAAPPVQVQPWSERDDYPGRHRASDPPPKGTRRTGGDRYRTGGPRQTPADDRNPAYFRRS